MRNKFSQMPVVPEWNLFYIDYDYLEEQISNQKLSSRNKEIHENKISKDVEHQLLKVNMHFKHLLSELKSKIENLKVNLNSNTVGRSAKSRENILLEINNIQKLFNNIASFCEVNYEGFLGIMEFHDSVTDNKISPWFIHRLKEQSFYQYSVPLGKLLLKFSDVCTQARSIVESSSIDVKSKKKDESYQSFVRETRKYFVKREDLIKVKSEIVKHLPIYVFNDPKSKLEEIDASPIHSVYFENPETLEIYSNRLRKTEGAYCIRLRTYNHPKYLSHYPTDYHNLPNPKTVFIERKTHHEGWVDANSVKERLELSASDVYDFLRGKYTVSDYMKRLQELSFSLKHIEESVKLFVEIQTAVMKRSLCPAITTQYDRTAFQLDGDASVRISIDSNLTLIKEKMKMCSSWYKENFEMDDNDVYLFPYAILEVKLQTHQGVKAPEWVTSLVSSNLVRRVEYFSKYIHGCSMHLPSKVPLLPHWIKEFNIPVPQNIDTNENIEIKNDENNQNNHVEDNSHISEDTFLVPMDPNVSEVKEEKPDLFIRVMEYFGVSVLDKVNNVPVTAPLKVEPKTFFANERTFLKWLTICLFIQATGIALLGFTDMGYLSISTGVIFIFASIIFMTYALIRFKIRTYRIKYHQKERYDDVHGPVALFAMITLVVLLNCFFYLANYLFDKLQSSSIY